MISLFLGLTAVNLLWLSVALLLGYYKPGHWHVLFGALAALTCVAVHCIVFTYFIATSKWVQHAVTVKRLDPAVAAPTRSFKAQAFPAALLGIAVVFATALLGARVDAYGASPRWHHAMALASLAVNVLVAAIEYRAINRNARLIDSVLALIKSAEPPGAVNPT